MMDHFLNQNQMKAKVTQKALEYFSVKSRLGIGTGSTIEHLIKQLIPLLHAGSHRMAFSSKKSEMLLKPYCNSDFSDQFTELDFYIDGADYVDCHGVMIKGGGGALTREKILMQASQRVIICIDETKWVDQPKQVILPIEILPFAPQVTLHRLTHLIKTGNLRRLSNDQPFITDNGNFIFDALIDFPHEQIHELNLQLKQVAGVVETGIFDQFSIDLLMAYRDPNRPVEAISFNS